MGLTRIATFKDAKREAVLLEVSGWKAELSHEDLATHNTGKKVETELKAKAAASNTKWPRVHVHVNRDGSLAVATGAAPVTWPEDEALRQASFGFAQDRQGDK